MEWVKIWKIVLPDRRCARCLVFGSVYFGTYAVVIC